MGVVISTCTGTGTEKRTEAGGWILRYYKGRALQGRPPHTRKEPISLAFAEPRHVNVEIVDTNQILQFYYYTKYTVVVRLVRLD